MNINYLFKMARECQGVKQADLAKKAGIKQPTLSQFESGMFNLSLDALLSMAPMLNINPEFLLGISNNPFCSSELIKMKLPEKILIGIDYAPLEFIVSINTAVQVVFLLAPTGIDKIITKTIIGQMTQAAIVRDQDGNTFIFRRSGRASFFVGEGDLQARLQQMEKDEKKTITITTQRISRTLSKKISEWDINIEDVQDILKSKMVTKRLSTEENRVIDMIRAEGIKPEAVEELLKKMKK